MGKQLRQRAKRKRAKRRIKRVKREINKKIAAKKSTTATAAKIV